MREIGFSTFFLGLTAHWHLSDHHSTGGLWHFPALIGHVLHGDESGMGGSVLPKQFGVG